MFDSYSCKCADDAIIYRKILEHKKIFKFFLGLNWDLNEVRGRIMGMKPVSPRIPLIEILMITNQGY